MRRVIPTVAIAPPAVLAPPEAADSLTGVDERLSWSSEGSASREAHAFDVALPVDAWAAPGGVQVGIKWQYSSDERGDFDSLSSAPAGPWPASQRAWTRIPRPC